MTLSRTSATIDAAPPPLTHPTRRVADRDREPPTKAWVPPDPPSPALRRIAGPRLHVVRGARFRGNTMRALWRCVNCGDYVDSEIWLTEGNALGRHENVHDHEIGDLNEPGYCAV